MAIAGIRLAIQAPEVLFGERACQKRYYTIISLLLIPIHPLLLCIKEEMLNQKLKGQQNTSLENARVDLRFHLRQFKRCELGIETVYQICGQAILALYAVTTTKTTEGLVKLFESTPKDKLSLIGSENLSPVFQSRTFILMFE